MALRISRARLRKLPGWVWVVVGFTCFALAVWFGGPLTGNATLSTLWLRATVIGVGALILAIVAFFRWRRRKRAAEGLEEAILPAAPVGDAKVLEERMRTALEKLKKSGGRTFLYDLPWYVIVGPPGAGKTTALVNAGIDFKVKGEDGGGLGGFGGTRACEWWFADEAILIDTAGRYTTQESDRGADAASWTSFLGLLKKARPKQPINGVLLAFSTEDLMTAGPDRLQTHAETIRARLSEIHDILQVDFPVYVLFTKADLISGFREYFARFSEDRRQAVWGATFQTSDRKATTFEEVPQEFDRLITRLSDEVIDRMNEELDGSARIAIFGFPGQMALLRDQVAEFLRKVFEPSPHQSNAILRGFYFTSGTREGTPIDQVLGQMAEAGDSVGAFQPAFLSGKGRSFFLHDLLTKVVFAERDWVSHDQSAVWRAFALRTVAFSLIGVATLGLLTAFGISFWNNRTLVQNAQAETARYTRAAQAEIARDLVDDPDLTPVIEHLDTMRSLPGGVGDTTEVGMWQGFGLSQWERIASASEDAYSDALERMLRPRLILSVERQLPEIVQAGDPAEIYRALKVYMLLGNQGPVPDDAAVKAWFDAEWRGQYLGSAGLTTRQALQDHLDAMLRLDDSRDIAVEIDEDTVQRARTAVVRFPLVDQAYALILDGAQDTALRDWTVLDDIGGASRQVFQSRNGDDLSTLSVPSIYTYEGYWSYFLGELADVETLLRNDQWVLDDPDGNIDLDAQLDTLEPALQDRYRREFVAAWGRMLANLGLASMAADRPRYDALGMASSPVTSPILALVKEVDRQTKLTRELEGLDDLDPAAIASGGAASETQQKLFNRFRSRTDGIQRILLDAVTGRKSQQRAGGGGGANGGFVAQLERIEDDFARWHDLLQGPDGQRPIDALLKNLADMRTNLVVAAESSGGFDGRLAPFIAAITQVNSQLPPTLASLMNDAEADFRTDASNVNIATINRALTNDLTFHCEQNITSAYPFGSRARGLSLDNFAAFFGPGGDMDRFFQEHLEPHVIRTGRGLAVDPNSALAERISPTTLRQFDHAQRIRDAYFPGGSRTPSVEIIITHVDSSSTVENAILSINDQIVSTAKGDRPRTVQWPGDGRSTVLQLLPQRQGSSIITLDGNAWTFIDLLGSATSARQQGDTLRATFTVDGRTITYDFRINSAENPFTMSALRQFSCPQSLD
ncbi:MAG: type VI secretion system membrane subunit TssM [Pseudomonadota bacterium]